MPHGASDPLSSACLLLLSKISLTQIDSMSNIPFRIDRRMFAVLLMPILLSITAFAQKITVRGLVTDESGEALIGAIVVEKGTSQQTSTDLDGRFIMDVEQYSTLSVKYVGYDREEIPVRTHTYIHVVMHEIGSYQRDYVETGYGPARKSDVIGAVSYLAPDESQAEIATSFQDLLAGAVPGVVVNRTSGEPDDGGSIRIRGGATLGAFCQPLIVLDGIPLSNDAVYGMSNSLAFISPENIESVTILKDASATAIYGARGADGVMIITTKRGEEGHGPKVNISAKVSVNTPRKNWDMLSGDEYASIIKKYWGANSEAAASLGMADTNWQKEITRNTLAYEYDVSVGGKVDMCGYHLFGSYTMNPGVIKDSGMQRVTVGAKLTPEFFGGLLRLTANIRGFYLRNQLYAEGCVANSLMMDPTMPVYSRETLASDNPSFPYFYNGYTSYLKGMDMNPEGVLNPVAEVIDTHTLSDVYRSNGNLNVDYALHFLHDLHLALNIGYDVVKSEESVSVQQNSPMAWLENMRNGAGFDRSLYELHRNTLIDLGLRYHKELDAIRSVINVGVGYSAQRFDSHGRRTGNMFTSEGFLLPSDSHDRLTTDPDTYALIETNYSPDYHWNSGVLTMHSFMGRLSYTFKDTYILTLSVRDDSDSYRDVRNHRGIFPSGVFIWKLLNMDFMEQAREFINDFKIRLGCGKNGLNIQPSLYPVVFSPERRWSVTKAWSAGVDMTWNNEKYSAGIDWYVRNSSDVPLNMTVASGFEVTDELTSEVASVRNLGLEAYFNARLIDTSSFSWTTSFNFAWNHNRVTSLSTCGSEVDMVKASIIGSDQPTYQVYKKGYPANSFLLYEQVYDAAGRPVEGMYADRNSDGKIDDADLVVRRSRDPKVTLSWNNTLRWGGWDFGIRLRAALGAYAYNDVLARRSVLSETWHDGALRNLIANDGIYFDTPQYYSDYYLRNAGFLRCDNITVGYTWPGLLNDFLTVRLYGAVQNPFVITGYNGSDPEVYGGVDRGAYPRPLTVTLGLMATF